MSDDNFQSVTNGQMQPGRVPTPPEKKTPGWAWAVGIVLVIGLLWVIGTVASDNEDEPATARTTTARVTTTIDQAASASRAAAASSSAAAAASASQAAAASRAAAAEASRQAAAAAEAARLDPNTYEVINPRDFALIAKAPEQHLNRKIVLYGHVSQFDSVTGASKFRADVDSTPHDYSFEYDTNSIIIAPSAGLIANVVEDDFVTMYVTVGKPTSYSTTLGGSTTVPTFNVNIINVTGSSK